MRAAALALSLFATSATAQPCGGPVGAFIDGVTAEARAAGIPAQTVDAFFQGARIDPAVIEADRAQGVFQRDFIRFSRALISQNRIDNGRIYADRFDRTFDTIEARFGIPRGVLLAFWAFETDYGQVQGNFNTRNALLTLAHDCRRPELFRPQLIAAIELYRRGGVTWGLRTCKPRSCCRWGGMGLPSSPIRISRSISTGTRALSTSRPPPISQPDWVGRLSMMPAIQRQRSAARKCCNCKRN